MERTGEKIRLQTRVLELKELARRAADDHRSLFERSGIVLTLDVPAEAVWVEGDSARIAQVIGTFLYNAARFTDRRGEVVLSVRREDGRAAVSVRDTGIGLEPDELSAIFQPLTREERVLDPGRGGPGSGLALARVLVEAQGGSIEARSAGRGKGAEFIFRLSLTAARPGAGSAPGSGEGERGLRVLIVEDNQDAAQSLGQVLRMFGHSVELAATGSVALEKGRSFRPQVVLCDIGLPGMDGYEVARAFRTDPALSSAVLVALTGYATPEDRQHALEAGFDRHLEKPPNLQVLSAVLAQVPRS